MPDEPWEPKAHLLVNPDFLPAATCACSHPIQGNGHSQGIRFQMVIFRVLPWEKSPEGPTIKKFNLARNFQSRSKFLISLENFNLDVSNSPQKIGPRGSLEIYILARNFQSRSKSRIFLIIGHSGSHVAGGRKSGLTNWCAFGPQGFLLSEPGSERKVLTSET